MTRELVTTLFEAFGLMFIIAGVSLGVAAVSIPAGLVVAGLGLLGASFLILKATAAPAVGGDS